MLISACRPELFASFMRILYLGYLFTSSHGWCYSTKGTTKPPTLSCYKIDGMCIIPLGVIFFWQLMNCLSKIPYIHDKIIPLSMKKHIRLFGLHWLYVVSLSPDYTYGFINSFFFGISWSSGCLKIYSSDELGNKCVGNYYNWVR